MRHEHLANPAAGCRLGMGAGLACRTARLPALCHTRGRTVQLMTAKILILTGDAAESLEVLYPYQRLLEEGYEVDIAAPTAKKLRFVVHDFEEGFDTYTEKPGYTWPADLAFADVDPEDHVALVIPGGRAPEYIRNNPDCQRIIQHFFSGDRPVAQIWHAPLA